MITFLARRLWLPALVLVGWWFAAQGGSFYMPKPGKTFDAMAQFFTSEGLQQDVLPTLSKLALGYAIAVVAGVGLGILLARLPLLRMALDPTLNFLRALPPPALLPFAIVAFGLGTTMKVWLIAFGAIWPTLLNTTDAMRAQARDLDDLRRIFRIPRLWQLFVVEIPAASPQIFAGMRTSLQYALTLIVLSELVASTGGIGHSVLLAQRQFQIDKMWAGILLLGLIGLILNTLFTWAEHRALRWQLGRQQQHAEGWITR